MNRSRKLTNVGSKKQLDDDEASMADVEEVLDDDEAPLADDDVATVPDIANIPIPHHLRGCCVPAFKRHKSANA